MDIVLFGPPGSGKGTQARKLSSMRGVPHISTGDMMRSERDSGSEFGQKLGEYMNEGKLVPDSWVTALIEKRLERPDAKEGAVFDGYPRTLVQAEALEKMLAGLGRKIGKVVALEVPLSAIRERISGRRVCLECGQTYHVSYNPPPSTGGCDSCGNSTLVQRPDDAETVVQARYEEHLAKTEPLIAYYQEKGLLRPVDGVGPVEEVQARILEALKSNGGGK